MNTLFRRVLLLALSFVAFSFASCGSGYTHNTGDTKLKDHAGRDVEFRATGNESTAICSIIEVAGSDSLYKAVQQYGEHPTTGARIPIGPPSQIPLTGQSTIIHPAETVIGGVTVTADTFVIFVDFMSGSSLQTEMSWSTWK